jgi:PEGA domain
MRTWKWRRLGVSCALGGLAIAMSCAARPAQASTMTITSTPAGATVEIDGVMAGTTPYHVNYPGGYFHKTKTIFGERLEHAINARLSLAGYATLQMTLTEGPFEWTSINGRRHGNYWLLKSEEFDFKLDASYANNGAEGELERPGPLRTISGRFASSAFATTAPTDPGTGQVAIESDVSGAEIYVDGRYMGQTPATIRLEAGMHRVRVEASGKREWMRDLDVIKDSKQTLHPLLDGAP